MILGRRAVIAGLSASALPVHARVSAQGAMRGFNVVETSAAPFGGDAAARSLRNLAGTGANCAALVPFLWQRSGGDTDIVLGDALPPDRMAAGIRQACAAGLRAIVKPHVWVPGGWAGQIAMRDDAGWQRWFAAYRAAMLPLARIAATAGAEGFVVGTEIRGSAGRPEWRALIAEVRAAFPRTLSYVAHGADEAERVAAWPLLDAVGVSLYPALGADDAPADWLRAMRAEVDRVERVARRVGKPLWIGEIGLRSAQGAAKRPWESAEERAAAVDGGLQARVLSTWLRALAAASPQLVLIWRWFSDPAAGGAADTDFTVQNKPAQAALSRAWRGRG